MAKRTPDYTKQVRHEKPRRPSAGPRKAGGPRNKRAPEAQVPAAPRAMAFLTFVSLAGGVGIYLYVWYLANPVSGGLVAVVCGLLVNVLVGVLAVYALDPAKHPMPRVNKRTLILTITLLGTVAVLLSVTDPLLSPGLIPPAAIFFYVIRPRLKLIAEAAGTYRSTRHDQALEEIKERRAERQREKEREAAMKRTIKQRLQRADAQTAGAEVESEVEGPASTATGTLDSRPAKSPGGKR